MPTSKTAKQFAGTADTEPIQLALELAQARQRLLACLLDNAYASRFLCEQLAGAQSPSDLPDLPDAESGSRVPLTADELKPQRILPLFLLNVAGRLVRKPNSRVLSSRYQQKLERFGKELQFRRQRMISANIGLSAFAAQKYAGSTLSFEDLMQEGVLGLIKAVDRFDPYRGICFSTYGMYWIRQAISRLIIKQEKIVRLPMPLAEKAVSVFEAMRNCYLQNERWPTLAELKASCDLPEADIQAISSYFQATHSLEGTVHRDQEDGQALMEKMSQYQFKLPLDELVDADLNAFLDQAVATLPEKQATILAMRFGLRNQSEMTLQAIADQLHVTRERVRQLQNEALEKLKMRFGCDLIPFLDGYDGTS